MNQGSGLPVLRAAALKVEPMSFLRVHATNSDSQVDNAL